MTDFKGMRWYKCDLHLHTIESTCFTDTKATSEQYGVNSLFRTICLIEHSVFD